MVEVAVVVIVVVVVVVAAAAVEVEVVAVEQKKILNSWAKQYKSPKICHSDEKRKK